MKVYIVEQGEFCEGAEILGVFSDYEKALKCALDYQGSTPYRITAFEPHTGNPITWEWGCEYIEIGQYEVE
jgi:hypothetical protein